MRVPETGFVSRRFDGNQSLVQAAAMTFLGLKFSRRAGQRKLPGKCERLRIIPGSLRCSARRNIDRVQNSILQKFRHIPHN